jgi:hypothetical protein
MNDRLSPSIFTVEVDETPVLAFATKKYSEAESICADERLRAKLRSVNFGGFPLCDDYGALRVRLAHSDERAAYRERSGARSSVDGLVAVFLVDLDET